MSEKAVEQKIAYLTELQKTPDRKDGTVLRIFFDIIQLTDEGRVFPDQTVEQLNKSAGPFLSAQLFYVLTRLRLEAYGFKFAALNFIDIEDVIDDLSYDNTLKNMIPPGAFNRMKRELHHQQNLVHQSMMELASTAAKYKKEEILFQNAAFYFISMKSRLRKLGSCWAVRQWKSEDCSRLWIALLSDHL